MQPFEIIDSPISERSIIQQLITKTEYLKQGDTALIISSYWWEAWKKFVNYDVLTDYPHDKGPKLLNGRSRSIVIGAKPIEIHNCEIIDPENPLKLQPNLA